MSGLGSLRAFSPLRLGRNSAAAGSFGSSCARGRRSDAGFNVAVEGRLAGE